MADVRIILFDTGVNSLISILCLIFLSVVFDCVITKIGHIAAFGTIFIINLGLVFQRD